MGELAGVYSALATAGADADGGAPAVVFTGVPPEPSVEQRLARFGVAAVVLATPAGVAPGVWLLGGTAHGAWFPEDAGADEPHAAVVALVERARLRDFAGEVGPEPTFTTMHKPGSDSRGVVQFRLGAAEVVAKIGDAAALAAEVRFATEVNGLLAGQGKRALFPEVHGFRVEGGQGVSLMEAGRPMPIAPLFADEERTTLADAALDILQPHLDLLTVWYRHTAQARRPTVGDYLYRERYHLLLEFPAFVSAFRAFFGDTAPAEILDVPVALPGGVVVPGYLESVAWLDTVAPDLLPANGSAVHGDIYAANMLLRADDSPVLIDPRTVWEGRDRPDVGFGDPVFDLSTLLHGVLPMAAILRAAETGTSDALFGAAPGPRDGRLNLSTLRLPMAFPPAVRALQERMLRVLPHDEPPHAVRARLYIGAATSLLGWLKYERSVRTAPAWLATFGYVAWYLDQARKVWDDRSTDGKHAS